MIQGVKLPDNSRRAPVVVKFKATLSAGFFVFNEKVDFYLSSVNDRLVLDGIEISADIDQLAFSKAIAEPFTLQLWRKNSSNRILQKPFPFAAFSQGQNFAADFSPTSTNGAQGEQIQLSINGSLKQTAELSGLSEITIYAAAMVYIVPKSNLRSQV